MLGLTEGNICQPVYEGSTMRNASTVDKEAGSYRKWRYKMATPVVAPCLHDKQHPTGHTPLHFHTSLTAARPDMM